MRLLPEIAQSLYDAWWAENGDSITTERVVSILKYGKDITLENHERYRTWCWIKNYYLTNKEFDLQRMTDDFVFGLYGDKSYRQGAYVNPYLNLITNPNVTAHF